MSRSLAWLERVGEEGGESGEDRRDGEGRDSLRGHRDTQHLEETHVAHRDA